MSFNNKVIVITGASSGIGLAAALLFANKGAFVFNLDIIEPSYFHKKVLWLKCNVSDISDVQSSFAIIRTHTKRIDYLFANAGIYSEAPLIEMSSTTIDEIINVNIRGVINVLRITLPIMKAQKNGSVVLMGSDLSFVGRKNSSIYGATKGAIGQLTKSLSIECASVGIRVNCVCPGAIMTPLTKKAIKLEACEKKESASVIYKEIEKQIPLKRFGTSEEVAHVVAFLCSEKASYITGNLVSIDGGVVASQVDNCQYNSHVLKQIVHILGQNTLFFAHNQKNEASDESNVDKKNIVQLRSKL